MKCQLKLIILNFWTKLTQNRYLQFKKVKKMKITIEFHVFELVQIPNFSFNKQFSDFKTIFLNKDNSISIKIKHHHWLLHIQVSLGNKCHFKQTPLSFGTIFAQNRCLWSRTEKVKITMKFCIFELVWVRNFTLKRYF